MVLKALIHNYYIGGHVQYVKGDNSVKTQPIIFIFAIFVRLIGSNIFPSLTYIGIQTDTEILSI